MSDELPSADDAPTYDPRTPLSRRLVTLARQIDSGAAPAYIIAIEDIGNRSTIDVHPVADLERVRTLALAITEDIQARGLVELGEGLSAPSEVSEVLE